MSGETSQPLQPAGMTEREKFEAWDREIYALPDYCYAEYKGGFSNLAVESRWQSWQAALESRRVELMERDAARLDWLEKHFTDIHGVYVASDHTVRAFSVDCEEDTFADSSKGRIREAIDAALSSAKEQQP